MIRHNVVPEWVTTVPAGADEWRCTVQWPDGARSNRVVRLFRPARTGLALRDLVPVADAEEALRSLTRWVTLEPEYWRGQEARA